MRISLRDLQPLDFDGFLKLYNEKLRKKAVDSHGKSYKIRVDSMFNVHLNRIWEFFTQFPQINISEYTDVVFEIASTVEECLPHRFLGAIYQRNYFKKQMEKCIDLNKSELRFAILAELEDVIRQKDGDWKRAVNKMKTNDATLVFDIAFGFPPVSMLAVSADYARFYQNATPEIKAKIVNPDNLKHLVPLVKYTVGIVDRLRAFAELNV